ncbi:MAG: hypothetical protein QOD35_2085 [Nocardioidaceae bacterium]|nr:hypothetical protein [Nocardioidaceae bacterium]
MRLVGFTVLIRHRQHFGLPLKGQKSEFSEPHPPAGALGEVGYSVTCRHP